MLAKVFSINHFLFMCKFNDLLLHLARSVKNYIIVLSGMSYYLIKIQQKRIFPDLHPKSMIINFLDVVNAGTSFLPTLLLVCKLRGVLFYFITNFSSIKYLYRFCLMIESHPSTQLS
jgi:hypothetical protein